MNAARWLGIAVCAASTAGCGSWVEVKPQARDVVALTAEQAEHCQRVGKVSASVLNEAGFFNRSRESMEADLTRLARNRAIELGGDAVAPLGPEKRGKQTFGVYRCFGATAANGKMPAARDGKMPTGFKTIPYDASGDGHKPSA